MLFVCVHCLLDGEQRDEVKWSGPGEKCGSVDSIAFRSHGKLASFRGDATVARIFY